MLKRKLREFRLLFIKYMSLSVFTSKLYYFFFNSRFDLEMQKVLAARSTFLNNKLINKSSTALLRRNIHRIEKV